ncbi:hypothetical protein [Pedomonas mirosovicensis]|uniref:hypothetical protein n=1 Tax=Pedomonas mirosovicensis TaxID=2908641 RepID=UPI002167DBAA|nr:hypothetical protein [Pedomonas mirosovicensis]MCH8684848.1 hypothetical protein [Pedomonas mirosovicensis]
MAKLGRVAVVLASLGMFAGTALPAQANADVEFDIPDGQKVDAEKMARALVEALETAGPTERPLLLQALAKVMEMSPRALIMDSGADEPQPIY